MNKPHEKRIGHKKHNVKFPIGLKLVLIFTLLLTVVVGMTVTVISYFFSNDERINAKANNFTINERMADSLQTKLLTVMGNSQTFIDYLFILEKDPMFDEESKILIENYFSSNPDVSFIYSAKYGFMQSSQFRETSKDAEKVFKDYLTKKSEVQKTVSKTDAALKDFSKAFNVSDLTGVFFPNRGELICVGVNLEKLKEACLNNKNCTYVFTKDGEPLIYETEVYDFEEDKPSLATVQEIISVKEASEYLFNDSDGKNWIYSKSTAFFNTCNVVTVTSESEILKSITIMIYRVIAFSLAIVFLAIIIIRIFSKTITNPIRDLVGATRQIDEGDYELSLRAKTHDEVGYLTKSFMRMAGGLEERQRLMSTFTKFVNKDIAQKAASGELTLGGEDKNATVFFSDIRSFTAMSEKMTAPQVVEFLNDYFTRMVDCVNKTNGIVDKFIGDAVMAVWGAATTCGTPEADAWAAVKAALMMRIALYHFNENQRKNGGNIIKIGCGINSGPIVAGQIGSDDHMNYTVIGDTVNLASRTEALNKPFHTDILITENTYLLIKDKIIVEEMPGVHVKGKEAAIKMYAVINAKGVKGPDTIEKLRDFLGWDEPEDLSKVNTDEEEQKFKIEQ